MYSCPACGAAIGLNRTTCACGADLSLLQRLDSVVDAWFNRALESSVKGEPGRALEWLSACCAARPTDVAARRAQAKAWAQLGRWEDALYALELAATINPEAPELEEIRQALYDAANERRRTEGRKPSGAKVSGSKRAKRGLSKKKGTRIKERRG